MVTRGQGSDMREAMVLVVGVTGSGKSRFINTLVEGAVKEYPGLHSGQQKPSSTVPGD